MVGFLQTGEIKALAGVDFLTISPNLLDELKNDTVPVPKKLDAVQGTSSHVLRERSPCLTRSSMTYSRIG